MSNFFVLQDGHWDTSRGSVEDRDAERSRWEIGARKAERAKAYAFSQQVTKNLLGYFQLEVCAVFQNDLFSYICLYQLGGFFLNLVWT